MKELPSIKSYHKLIVSTEWRWVFLCAVLVMILTSLPYLIAFQKALPQGDVTTWRFSGFLFGVEDGNSYIAKMRRGTEGEWLYRSPYSGMEQKGLLAFLPYYLIGKLVGGKGLHEQLVVLFHWFRIVAGILCIFATYRLVSEYIVRRRWRGIALVLITLGGGLGWIMLLNPDTQNLPLEFYSPEAFGFLSLYGLPHLSLARAFMLLAIIEYSHLWDNKEIPENTAKYWRLSLYWLGAGLSQPIHAGILGVIFALHLIVIVINAYLRRGKPFAWKKLLREGRSFLLAVLPTLILVSYTFYCFLTDPYLKIWTSQNRLPNAPLSSYLLAYGWLAPLLVGGIGNVWNVGNEKGLLLLIWLGATSLLIFAPIPIQRRLIEGIWIVVILISISFLESMEIRPKLRKLSGVIALLLLFCSSPTSFLLIFGGVQSALSPRPPVFVPEHHAKGYEALNHFEGAKNAIVLASYESSNALPAYAFVRVIIGHGPESPHGDILVEEVRKVYDASTPDNIRRDFIRGQHVKYIVWGDNERNLGDWQPLLETYLVSIHEDEGFIIFEVDWAKMDN